MDDAGSTPVSRTDDRCEAQHDCVIEVSGFAAILLLECDYTPGHEGLHHDWEHHVRWQSDPAGKVTP